MPIPLSPCCCFPSLPCGLDYCTACTICTATSPCCFLPLPILCFLSHEYNKYQKSKKAKSVKDVGNTNKTLKGTRGPKSETVVTSSDDVDNIDDVQSSTSVWCCGSGTGAATKAEKASVGQYVIENSDSLTVSFQQLMQLRKQQQGQFV